MNVGIGPVLLRQGFRPFFLAAAVWAVVTIGIWLSALSGWWPLATSFNPMTWHVHEAIYGFAAAAMAGFLLTAIPNWTGRLPVSGGPLALLLGLWVIGRVACAVSALLPPAIVSTMDLAFPIALAAVVAREIIAGRNWRNFVMFAAISLFGIGNALMHAEATVAPDLDGIGWRLGLAILLAMIGLIGGRIIPSFTRNWLVGVGQDRLPAAFGPIDRLALIASLVSLATWVFMPQAAVTGWLLIIAGLVHGARLTRWRGIAARSEPLLGVLHVGYGWLAAGLVLFGASILGSSPLLDGALHALTAGAVGTMILAVMTRATLGHTGQSLTAGPGTVAIYGLVSFGALLRVGAPIVGAAEFQVVALGGVLWIAAFILFIVLYGPVLWASRPNR